MPEAPKPLEEEILNGECDFPEAEKAALEAAVKEGRECIKKLEWYISGNEWIQLFKEYDDDKHGLQEKLTNLGKNIEKLLKGSEISMKYNKNGDPKVLSSGGLAHVELIYNNHTIHIAQQHEIGRGPYRNKVLIYIDYIPFDYDKDGNLIDELIYQEEK